jgi:hypothetical protein
MDVEVVALDHELAHLGSVAYVPVFDHKWHVLRPSVERVDVATPR